MLILGTAGHIDHGKTTLVTMLTGRDLDTLPEEVERGITIALGFTHLDLPNGHKAALIDVPGHERLVRTMVAGATGMHAVMLVVSAVDGVMPQTREHLDILGLLGLEHGIVVLTMCDLVDEEMVELAIADVEDAVLGTFLEDAPIIPCSGHTGAGREAILEAISAFPAATPSTAGAFRLPIDRSFSRPGFGTVVTGTAWSGALQDGATVQLLPEARNVRLRGIQVHGERASEARAGHRVALNLAGVETSEVARGTVVAIGHVPSPRMIDVLYTHKSGLLVDGAPVRVLLGTAEVIGRLHAAADTELFEGELPAQLRLDRPLPCLPGDRFIIRRTSPMETLGGGVVVDPYVARMRKKSRVAHGQQTRQLAAGDKQVWLARAADEGLTVAEWRERGGTGGECLANRVFSTKHVRRWQGLLLEALSTYHDLNPLALGAHRRELRQGRLAHLDERVFDALVDQLANSKMVDLDGPIVRIAGFQIALDDAQNALRNQLAEAVHGEGFAGLAPKLLHERFPSAEVAAMLRLLEKNAVLNQVSGVGWVSRTVSDELVAKVKQWFTDHDALTPGEFKDLAGLTRKTAIPWLEWLDKQRYTAFGPEGRRTVGSQL